MSLYDLNVGNIYISLCWVEAKEQQEIVDSKPALCQDVLVPCVCEAHRNLSNMLYIWQCQGTGYVWSMKVWSSVSDTRTTSCTLTGRSQEKSSQTTARHDRNTRQSHVDGWASSQQGYQNELQPYIAQRYWTTLNSCDVTAKSQRTCAHRINLVSLRGKTYAKYISIIGSSSVVTQQAHTSRCNHIPNTQFLSS